MKRSIKLLLLFGVIGCLSGSVFAQNPQPDSILVFLELESSVDVGFDSVSAVTGVGANQSLYLSIYVQKVPKFMGVEFRIDWDDNITLNSSSLTTRIEVDSANTEISLLDTNSLGFVQKLEDPPPPEPSFLIAQTRPSSATSLDIGSVWTFIGRVQFTTGSSYTTSDSTKFTIRKALFAWKDGAALSQVFPMTSNVYNAAINSSPIGSKTTVPVELTSFTAQVIGDNDIELSWETASETNNLRFDILRSLDSENFDKIGEVAGAGTTTEINRYSFVDETANSGDYYYRLRQVDIDGTINLLEVIDVNVPLPDDFELGKNFPNPFNPSTKIPFKLRETGTVKITVFNVLGQQVATIVNQEFVAGTHTIDFNASALATGTYIYQMEVNGRRFANKFTIIK